MDVNNTLDFPYRAVLTHFQDFAVGGFGEVRGTFPLTRHLGHAAAMIAVLVGDQNGVHMFGTFPAEGFEAPKHFLAAEAGVNQESRAPGFKQRGVARAARGQNRYAERHRGDDGKVSWRRQRKKEATETQRYGEGEGLREARKQRGKEKNSLPRWITELQGRAS